MSDLRTYILLLSCIVSMPVLGQDAPEILVNTPQAVRTATGECTTSLVAGTNFSSSTIEGAYSYDISDISYVEPVGNSISLSGDLAYSDDFGNFHSDQSQGNYAIVSNPNVLNADYTQIYDDVNRLVVALGENPSGREYVMFTYKLQNLKPGTDVRLTFNADFLNQGCTPEDGILSQTDFLIKANSGTQGSGTQGFGPLWFEPNRQPDGSYEFVFEDLLASTLNISFIARYFRPCDAVAFSNINIYGCMSAGIRTNDNSNIACEGGFVNLMAEGFDGLEGDFVWQYATAPRGPWETLPFNDDVIMAEVVMGSNYFKVIRGNMMAEIEIMGTVCCAEDNMQEVIFHEDFGTTTVRTNNERIDAIGYYTYVPTGKVGDNHYCIVSNLDQAEPGSCAWPGADGSKTDHTGNENGAFLVINAGDLQNKFYERSIGSEFCEDTYYSISMYAANLNTGNWAPPEFSFAVVEAESGDVLDFWHTGEILDYSEDGLPLKWHRYGFAFKPDTDSELLLQIFSTSREIQGNDFAIDDIVVTTCKPEVRLYADYENGKIDAIGECNRPIKLTAVPSGNITSIIPQPYYLWQISEDGETWMNYVEGENLTETTCAPRKGRPWVFRVIVSKSSEIAHEVADGNDVDFCGVYIITNTATIRCEENECPDIEKPLLGQEKYVYCSGAGIPEAEITVPDDCVLAWYEDEYLLNPVSEDPDFLPEVPGTYYIVAKPAGTECVSEPVRIDIAEVPLPPVSILLDNNATVLTCEVQAINLTAVAGNVDFYWPHNGALTSEVMVEEAGTYTVEVQDLDTGCENSASIEITDERDDCEPEEPEDPDKPEEPEEPEEPVNPDEPDNPDEPEEPENPEEPDNPGFDEDNDNVSDIRVSIYFTPNGDGMNDLWEIGNIGSYPDAVILIYDRFTRLLRRYTGNDKGWDGTYNGHPMPMDDYWYIIAHPQLGTRSGHFTLKR